MHQNRLASDAPSHDRRSRSCCMAADKLHHFEAIEPTLHRAQGHAAESCKFFHRSRFTAASQSFPVMKRLDAIESLDQSQRTDVDRGFIVVCRVVRLTHRWRLHTLPVSGGSIVARAKHRRNLKQLCTCSCDGLRGAHGHATCGRNLGFRWRSLTRLFVPERRLRRVSPSTSLFSQPSFK